MAVQTPNAPSIKVSWRPRPTPGPSRYLAHVLIVALTSTLAGCGAEEPAPTFTNSGAQFVIETGEEFSIVLESNLTTGYSWALAVDLPMTF